MAQHLHLKNLLRKVKVKTFSTNWRSICRQKANGSNIRSNYFDELVGIQDMGAAGLTSSSSEMAAKGGSGLHLRLDQVPTREPGISHMK